MNFKELLKYWSQEELFRFDSNLLTEKGVDEPTMDFLSIIGLPKSAAPFLTFGDDERSKSLNSILEIYETEEFTHKFLLNIGSDSAGNPICIDLTKRCQVVALNHDQELESYFVNTSVKELFQFLGAYREFVNEVISLSGESAFLDCRFTDKQYENLKNKLKLIDGKALSPDTFWFFELDTLLVNREYYQKEK